MTMTPRLRKLALTAHITFSVGWLGAVAAYLALAIAGLTSKDAQTVRAAFFAMELIGWFVIVPCSLIALATGLVQSLGTEWGLFRHYWILAKFLLTIGGITVLLLHMPAVSRMAGVAAGAPLFSGAFGGLQHPTFVVHASGGLLVLLAATVLSVYKPWGMTPYGRHKISQPTVRPQLALRSNTRWPVYVLVGITGLVLLLIVLHLLDGGLRGH